MTREDRILKYKKIAEKASQFKAMTCPKNIDKSDLLGPAYEGLIKAIDIYDPTLGVPESAYVRKCVNWAMQDYLREGCGIISLTDSIMDMDQVYNQTDDKLELEVIDTKIYINQLAEHVSTLDDRLAKIFQLKLQEVETKDIAKIFGISERRIVKLWGELVERLRKTFVQSRVNWRRASYAIHTSS